MSFPTPQVVASWDWQTANDFPERDPTKWTLEGSNDGAAWTVIDDANARRAFPTTPARLTWQGPFVGCTEAAPRAECPWIDLGPTDGNNLLGCFDGSFCNGSDEGWSCCNERGGRARCPRNLPNMCITPNECGGDYCCEVDCMAENGVTNRPCPASPGNG